MRLPSLEVALVAKKDIRTILRNNAVTVMFVVLCTICMIFSKSAVGLPSFTPRALARCKPAFANSLWLILPVRV